MEVEFTLSDYEYNMLESANIPGIIKMKKLIIDGKNYLSIPVDRCTPLTQKLIGYSLNVEMFYEFFRQLLITYEGMQLYLLDESMICLDPDYIYYDATKNKYVFLPISKREQSIHEKFDKLLTFFIDWCDLEEKELLGFIFEVYTLLEEQKWDIISLVKYIHDYKFEKKKGLFEKECELFEEEAIDIENEDEEKKMEKSTIIGALIVCAILLVIAFYFSYVLAYNFKYFVISIVVSFLAIGLMAYQIYRISKMVLIEKSI